MADNYVGELRLGIFDDVWYTVHSGSDFVAMLQRVVKGYIIFVHTISGISDMQTLSYLRAMPCVMSASA